MTSRCAILAFSASVACACADKPPPAVDRGVSFPALPRTNAEADTLIAAETKRPPPVGEIAIDASTIVKAAEERGFGALPSDFPAIVRFVQEALDRSAGDFYLLFGVWHDAPGHLDAFRRLFGPGGLRGLGLVAAELFRADGAWQGVPASAQRGDDAQLEAWVARGDRSAFAALAERHREGDYAAWKLGYEETALDLLITARATGTRFAGCDMPGRIQVLTGTEVETRNRLREIHCLRSLPSTSPRRVAMLWGVAHVRASGIVRFIPPAASVLSIHVYGTRQVAGVVELGLASRLVVNDPVLVPLAGGRAALLLPDETIGGRIDRVLTPSDGSPIATSLIATAEIDGVLVAGDHAVPVGREPVTVPLPPGAHTYAFTAKGRTIVGAAKLAAGHRVEISFDPDMKQTSYVERGEP